MSEQVIGVREEVGGKMATVDYLVEGFRPAPSRDAATLVKVVWDGGAVSFLVPDEEEED